MEVIANLHWIKGLFSNIFLWKDEEELILVDTGQPGDARRISNYLSEIGKSVSDITSILITHADYDHAGTVATMHKQSGAPVFTSMKTAELLVVGKSPEHMPGPIQFLLNTIFRYQPLPASAIRVVDDGETITDKSQWRLLATPGHSPDHHSFWSPVHSLLFAGDALSTRGNQLKCSPKRNTADMAAARRSAMKLLLLTPAVFACGHGPPIHDHSSDQLFMLYRELEEQLP
ncbi:MAG TPA: MBL fold metallo-hydrolase [candidate division Zixibacteria bacterium]|nr:MBL fold metallo-hydrolase [candidate division Zixibacteria bacterium]